MICSKFSSKNANTVIMNNGPKKRSGLSVDPWNEIDFLGDEITEINLSDEQKISLVDEIPSLLLNEAPLPVFSLRLFYQLILYAYADFANFIPKSGIIEVLITFVEMQSTEQSNQMLQKQLYPLLSLLWEKCHLDSIFLLLENDFITVSCKILI